MNIAQMTEDQLLAILNISKDEQWNWIEKTLLICLDGHTTPKLSIG